MSYRPLFQRIVIANGLLLLAVCVATYFILKPKRVAEVETDAILVAALCLLTLVNLVMVRRVVAPLQSLTSFARSVDPERPGDRIPQTTTASEASELARTINEMLDRLERQRAEATRRVLAAHESERLRIAQELHDEVGQTLTALLLQLSRVQARLPEEARDELSEAQTAARASLEDVRRIAVELRPETLNDLGLVSGLAALSDGFAQRAGISLSSRFTGEQLSITAEVELAIYRIAQEALTNVARHSGSKRADLALESRPGQLVLMVRDYGRGISDEAQAGNGVRGMRERATAIGAMLTLRRLSPGPGTEMMLTVPTRSSQ